MRINSICSKKEPLFKTNHRIEAKGKLLQVQLLLQGYSPKTDPWWTPSVTGEYSWNVFTFTVRKMCIIYRCGVWSRGVSGSQMPRRPWRPAHPPTTTMRRSPDSWRERTRSYRRSSRRSAHIQFHFLLSYCVKV